MNQEQVAVRVGHQGRSAPTGVPGFDQDRSTRRAQEFYRRIDVVDTKCNRGAYTRVGGVVTQGQCHRRDVEFRPRGGIFENGRGYPGHLTVEAHGGVDVRHIHHDEIDAPNTHPRPTRTYRFAMLKVWRPSRIDALAAFTAATRSSSPCAATAIF